MNNGYIFIIYDLLNLVIGIFSLLKKKIDKYNC